MLIWTPAVCPLLHLCHRYGVLLVGSKSVPKYANAYIGTLFPSRHTFLCLWQELRVRRTVQFLLHVSITAVAVPDLLSVLLIIGMFCPGLLEISTVKRGVVTLLGVRSGLFIAMNNKGKLYGSVSADQNLLLFSYSDDVLLTVCCVAGHSVAYATCWQDYLTSLHFWPFIFFILFIVNPRQKCFIQRIQGSEIIFNYVAENLQSAVVPLYFHSPLLRATSTMNVSSRRISWPITIMPMNQLPTLACTLASARMVKARKETGSHLICPQHTFFPGYEVQDHDSQHMKSR